MRKPREREKAVCGYCGDVFVVTHHYRLWCGQSCETRGSWTPPPEVEAMLESMSLAFIAAVRIDPGYVIEIMAEAAVMLDRKGLLPQRDAA